VTNSHQRCKNKDCKKEYGRTEDMIPLPNGSYACDHDCIMAVVIKDRIKRTEQAREQLRWKKKQEKKIDLKVKKMKKDHYANDRGLRQREAQKAFNAFIRKRDELEPCISCGGTQLDVPYLRGGYWDCGHFKTVGGFPELRFEELNAHKQCKSCNGGSGRFARKDRTVSDEYKKRLAEKIGQESYAWLNGPHDAKNYTCADFKEIELKYKKKLKQLTISQ